MKKALFSFALVACSLMSFSGEKDSTATKKSRHEIMFGVNNPLYKSTFGSINDVYSYMLLNDVYDYYYYPYYYSTLYSNTLLLSSLQDGRKLGLGYRFHLKNSSIRILLNSDMKNEEGTESYDYDNNNIYSDFISNQGYSYKMNSYQARIGYQLHKTKGKVQLFYGLDFFYKSFLYSLNQSYTYSDWSYEYVNNAYEYVLYENKYENTLEYSQSSIGFSPILGLRYFLNENLSLSTESYVDFGMNANKSLSTSKVNYKDIDYDDYTTESIEESKGKDMKITPVSLISLNFHF